jgi:hypothetical protein
MLNLPCEVCVRVAANVSLPCPGMQYPEVCQRIREGYGGVAAMILGWGEELKIPPTPAPAPKPPDQTPLLALPKPAPKPGGS